MPRPPINGGTRCGKHGDGIPSASGAAERGIAEQETLEVVKNLGTSSHHTDIAGAALLEEFRS